VIELTQKHPILVVKKGKVEMVQAKSLVVGNVLQSTNGEKISISNLSSRVLPTAENQVYNVNTFGYGGNDHVIVANGFRVGDLAWQNKLSERIQRTENLVKYK
jgi:hypothetical protein